MKCRPSGRNAGAICSRGPSFSSSVRSGFGVPPAAGTRAITDVAPVNKITSSLFQVPAGPVEMLQIVVTSPPATLTRFNFPSAVNAMFLPSGDQNGAVALFVPGNGCDDKVSKEWTQSVKWPLESGAV